MTIGRHTERTMRLLIAAALVLGAREAHAQYLSASGSPAPMAVQTALAGTAPQPDTDVSTTYTVFSWLRGTQKITAQINSPMPTGVTLKVQLEAPAGAESKGAVALSTTARDVVTGIDFAITTRSITYELSATVAAGVVPRQSRTVTLTLTAAP
jgi:hypothetical protein